MTNDLGDRNVRFVLSLDAYLVINPTLIFRPPSLSKSDGWIVEDVFAEKIFNLDDLHALAALYFARPQTAERAAAALINRCGLSFDAIMQVIERLSLDGVLIEKIESSISECAEHANKTRSLWWNYGWVNACEYHLATYNSRFIPATREGRLESNEVMKQYADVEKDSDRTKNYPKARRIELPSVSAQLIASPYGRESDDLKRVSLDELGSILSIVFGVVRKRRPAWNGAPLIFRTSPSGGARQPTEGYLVCRSVEGLSSGLYHISVDPPGLEHLKVFDDLPPCYTMMLQRSGFPISAVIVLTTVFERNMYRYRESRTYRTVHMDAGHLCGSLEVLLKNLGFRTFVQYGPDDRSLHELIGVHPLQEGIQISIGIGLEGRSDASDR